MHALPGHDRSAWLDSLRWGMTRSGGLAAMIPDGLPGLRLMWCRRSRSAYGEMCDSRPIAAESPAANERCEDPSRLMPKRLKRGPASHLGT
jgi:hypothetical protein